MLCGPEVVVCLSELLDMTTVAIIGELERMQGLVVVLLENAERCCQILSISLGEKIGQIILTL